MNVLSPEQRMDIIRSRGTESATEIAARLGVNRNSVLSTWARFRSSLNSAKHHAKRPEPVARQDAVRGLHGVSLPRLRCLEDAR